MTNKKCYVTTGYVPDNCDYLTAGSQYEFEPDDDSMSSGYILDDHGEKIFIILKCSHHLNNRPWQMMVRFFE